jgi:spore coat polysaccharide biosynthesis predicted glycosyltransferase SpsG
MGHLYRVLNFCESLIERNIPFRIFTNPNEVSRKILVQRNLPFELVALDAEKNDWQAELICRYGIRLWIDDRLNTDYSHAIQIKRSGIPRVTFDDRGSGAELADLNVVALAFDESEELAGAKVLRGPRFLVLNREIKEFRRLRTTMGSVVVSMGGSDTYGVTMRVLQKLKSVGLGATVITGPAFEHQTELSMILDDGFVLKRSVPSLIEEFSHHDLAITGGGITPFEANASGLPCIVIANEEFEIPVGRGLAMLGGVVFAGYHADLSERLIDFELPIERMSRAAMEAVDLCGAERVLCQIEALL